MKCAQTLEVGVYVLGALSPAERDAFERHLGECAICREEVADLAVLPGLLGRLDAATAIAVARDGEASSALLGGGPDALPDEQERWAGPTAAAGWAGPTAAAGWAGPTAAPQPTDPDEPEGVGAPGTAGPVGRVGGAPVGGIGSPGEGIEGGRWAGPTVIGPGGGDNVVSLLEAARRRRAAEKRRRGFTTAAGLLIAACLALVVGFGAPRLFRDGSPPGPTFTAMSQVVTNTPVSAELALEPVASGTKVIMRCRYKGVGPAHSRWVFHLVAVPTAGRPTEEVGTWSAGDGDEIQMTLVTELTPDQIDRIELRGSDGRVLLVYDR